MKPRCEVHKSPLQWTNAYRVWVCMQGTRDRTCQAFRRDLAAPVKLRVFRPTHTTWDGREILSPADWDRRRVEVWRRDGKVCQGQKMVAPGVWEKCGKALPDIRYAEIDHLRARGMGGGWRDDRMENLQTLCKDCHKRKGRMGHGWGVAAAVYGPADPQITQMTPSTKSEEVRA